MTGTVIVAFAADCRRGNHTRSHPFLSVTGIFEETTLAVAAGENSTLFYMQKACDTGKNDFGGESDEVHSGKFGHDN